MTRFLIALCVSLFWATIALFTLTPTAAPGYNKVVNCWWR